tara:strand:- start:745 stop:879 length:135 start_codon:yes stop_codon:yes gene_type:complete
MDYLSRELEEYQYRIDTTCEKCGESTDPDYYDCNCEDEDEEEEE